MWVEICKGPDVAWAMNLRWPSCYIYLFPLRVEH